MDIQNLLLSPQALSRTASAKLSEWMVGKLLNAIVTGKDKPGNTITLQINNQKIEAKSIANNPIHVGDKLKLVVEKSGNPVELRVVQHESVKQLSELKQQVLRENLPKQESLKALVETFNKMTNKSTEILKTLPLPVQRQLQKFIDHLPVKTNLQNDHGLKNAVKNSGVFLEKNILQQVIKQADNKNPKQAASSEFQRSTSLADVSKSDLKANLLKLSEVISSNKPMNNGFEVNARNSQINQTTNILQTGKPQPTGQSIKYMDIASKLDIESISKQLESSIARVETNQTRAIVTAENPVANWSIEIPVKDNKDIDLLQLQIQPDTDTTGSDIDKQSWTVNLNIDFGEIGSLSARLSLIGDEVSASLWSSQNELNSLVSKNLSRLEQRMQDCGLVTKNISCHDTSHLTENEMPQQQQLISISI